MKSIKSSCAKHEVYLGRWCAWHHLSLLGDQISGRGLVILSEVDRGLRGRFFKMADLGAEKMKDVE